MIRPRMIRPRMFAAALLVALPFAALAQDLPGAADPSRITGGRYAVDPDHTQVTWSVDHMGITPLTGMFGRMSGTLELDPKTPDAAKVEIVLPVAGLVVTSEEFGKHLASPDFFDAAKFPEARFRSTKVTASGDDATIDGELTLHGVTRPVTLSATFFGAGLNPMNKQENVGFTASATLKRSEFGLGYGVPVVSDEVKLTLVGAFAKAP